MSVLYSLNGTSQIPALRLKDLCRLGGSRIVRMRRGRSSQNIFQTQEKDAEIMGTCTRPTQDQSKHIPTRRMRSGHDMLPQDEELLAFDCYLESKRQFFFFIN